MNDYISRQAAITFINSLYPNMPFMPRNRRLWQEKYKDFIFIENCFRNFPPAQQWTPCSERLPNDEEKVYWICTDTGYQCQCKWTKGGWRLYGILQYMRVIAWQQLPAPYQE